MNLASTAFGPKPKLAGAALAPLVYWLLMICGLAGITVLRFGSYGSFVTSDDVVALWAGSVIGVALGQGVSAARIRLWVPIVIGMFGFWFLLPILFLVVDGIFGATAQTFLLAFMPALVCGYLSLTERGALVSFWYPAVLWMIVILDGPVPGVFDERFALPFVVGLAALFVVYLRARQTRRVAIWKAHGTERLADTLPRTVLRASPIRAAGQHVFSAMTGAAALVLTAWIAPHLWQTVQDPWRAPSAGANASPYAHASGSPDATSAGKPCCPIGMKKRERVKEYFPLQRAHDTDEEDVVGAQCRVCNYDGAYASNNPGIGVGNGKWSYGGTPGSGLGKDLGSEPFGVANPWGYGSSYGSGSWNTTTNDPTPTTPITTNTSTSTTTTTDPLATAPLDPIPAVTPTPQPIAAATPTTTATTTGGSTSITSTDPGAGPGTVTGTPAGPSPAVAAPPGGSSLAFPAPWKSSLALCTIAFAFILFTRAVRRALTLRHLAHPFWNESFDQRISNQWERMLVGLRDAGLQPGEGEQPLAFAKRIGIEGMEACATILERVRHGVRVDSEDLTNMRASAEAVFRTARQRAGAFGRATAWLRPPTV